MIKKTIYLGNPYHIRLKNAQLEFMVPEGKGIDSLMTKKVPLEDLGVLILDHPQITITHPVLQQIAAFNVALVSCDANHMPASLLMPLEGHNTQQERFRAQINASEPLKKQLWQQTIKCKIYNQGKILIAIGKSEEGEYLLKLSEEVRSGDTANMEGRAAAYYWKNIFSNYIEQFTRDRIGPSPNHLLNYAYAIIRATVARALVGSGLLPTLGIHHQNKYNAYCLADDIMEPYRPYADKLIYEILLLNRGNEIELSKEIKGEILALLGKEVILNNTRSPMMVAIQKTTSSLAQCYEGDMRKLLYPEC
ncbi:MAG: type II CRISPR-associated endonuclease Cas1 [Bacteroidetes bacterium]|nr:type II CRISPR-associated endonuclease Cas1 [Bacteroidota bacterium]